MASGPLDAILGIGGLINGAFQGAANRKVQREGLNLNQNENIFGSQLAARNEQRTAQSDAYRKALMAALGLGTTDVHLEQTPGESPFRPGFNNQVANLSYTGGATPSALAAGGGLEAMRALKAQAMESLLNPTPVEPLRTIQIGKNQKMGH